MKIEFIAPLPPGIEEKMTNDLVKYETSNGVDVNYNKFALIMKDDAHEAIGVLNAFTAYSEVYIEDMWIDSMHRGRGYGKLLINSLEERFQGKGFNNINLITSKFQAPEFYKKCGFQLEFVRENIKNPKLSKFFFIKYFNDEQQTQGILENI